MTNQKKYLETLKNFDEYVTVSEWAEKVGELYPELLEIAEEQIQFHTNTTTGVRAIAARISARLGKGRFEGFVKIDNSERPRKVRYITKEELEENTSFDIEEDLEPLSRREKEKEAENTMLQNELYRIDEFRNIQKSFKAFFNLDFEIDHAKALLNKKDEGKHHPDNFQLILKYHNSKKSNKNWERFSFEEQEDYIKKTIALQSLLASRMELKIDDNILSSILIRLKAIY